YSSNEVLPWIKPVQPIAAIVVRLRRSKRCQRAISSTIESTPQRLDNDSSHWRITRITDDSSYRPGRLEREHNIPDLLPDTEFDRQSRRIHCRMRIFLADESIFGHPKTKLPRRKF